MNLFPPRGCDAVYRPCTTANFWHSAAPLITTIQKLFSEDLAKENDFLRQENKILRSKLGKRVPLTKAAVYLTVSVFTTLRAVATTDGGQSNCPRRLDGILPQAPNDI